MAYFLFIDESGQDRQESPYEVIAGIAIEDENLWNLIVATHSLEYKYFGLRYSLGRSELKAKKFLNKKTFRLAQQLEPIPLAERRVLAKSCLEDGKNAGKREITALAQSKLDYIRELLQTALNFKCKAFASIYVNRGEHDELIDYLRKDYVYFLERYFYFLEDQRYSQMGIIVFDELEKSQSHILLSQIENYFKKTEKGKERASKIILEPLFVHSDLTSGIQIADIIAYIISWGYRIKGMDKPHREELLQYIHLIRPMRFKTTREMNGIENFEIWSINVV